MSMSLGQLIESLQGLQEQEDNALPEFPVVIRIDLGPEQDFHVSAVYVAGTGELDEERDPYVVVEVGALLLPGEDPWNDVEQSELW